MQELAELLQSLGVKRTTSLVLQVLSDCEYHELRDIERKADLQQPEVSTAITSLSNYIKTRKVKGGGIGRKRIEAFMNKNDFQKYLGDICKSITDRHTKEQEAISKLRNL